MLDLTEMPAPIAQINVFNDKGQLVSSIEEMATGEQTEIKNTAALASGTYWIRIDCNGEYGWVKAIKI
jgi:hypothetical protein